MRIFDVQRASFVDGPGVRTVIFFKGCNLRCKWCHNPESWTTEGQLMYYDNRCVHCGRCLSVCPTGAIDENIYTDRTKCSACGACTKACLVSARMLCGQEGNIDKLFATIAEDRCFYEGTGGGVTFSGGECMLQIDFLCKLARKCHENGIHTAVDTAGNVPWAHFEQVLPYTDMFLYDMKLITAQKHRAYTGVDNTLILQNLTMLLEQYPNRVRIRIPVLPAINAETGELEKMRDFLAKHRKPNGIDLLPYHRLGENKLHMLGSKQGFTCRVPTKEEMQEWNHIFDSLR